MSLTSILVSSRLRGQEFIQYALRRARGPGLGDQVRPAPPGPLHRTLESPAADPGMIARQ